MQLAWQKPHQKHFNFAGPLGQPKTKGTVYPSKKTFSSSVKIETGLLIELAT